MMDALALHPHTKTQLDQFAASPVHAMLLVGATGVGKGTLAKRLAAQLLNLDPDILGQHQYVKLVAPQNGTISIETIRELQHFLQLRTIGDQRYRRAILIEQSGALTIEAQNAFLKLLEEPPQDTLLLLTADTPRAVLPTIRSRVQILPVYPPGEDQLKTFFAQTGKQAPDIERAYFLSGGLPGLMHALLAEEEHPLLQNVATAKELLLQPLFERLAQTDSLARQKADAIGVLEALLRIAQAGLDQAGKKQDAARIQRWHHVLKEVFAAQSAMQANASAKLVLTNLMLRI